MVFTVKLDIGCGLRKRGDIGVDINRESEVDVMADAHYLPFRESSFDKVTAYALLEHVDNPSRAIAEMSRVCVEEGYVTVLVPVASRMLVNLLIYCFTFQFKAAMDVYRCNKKREHKWQFSIDGLVDLLRRRGFQVFDIKLIPPDYYGELYKKPFLRPLERIHRLFPIYEPHLVIKGRKTLESDIKDIA